MPKLDCIMLVDDSRADLRLHSIIIEDADCAENVVCFQMAADALAALRSGEVRPDLIFLDINMPAMNGWEFAEAYQQLPDDARQARLVMMLSTSLNPADRERAEVEGQVDGFYSKPLTEQMCRDVVRSVLQQPQ